jgi:hypothetical protein
MALGHVQRCTQVEGCIYISIHVDIYLLHTRGLAAPPALNLVVLRFTCSYTYSSRQWPKLVGMILKTIWANSVMPLWMIYRYLSLILKLHTQHEGTCHGAPTHDHNTYQISIKLTMGTQNVCRKQFPREKPLSWTTRPTTHLEDLQRGSCHYQRGTLCRVSNALPSAIYRAHGKLLVCLVPDTQQR